LALDLSKLADLGLPPNNPRLAGQTIMEGYRDVSFEVSATTMLDWTLLTESLSRKDSLRDTSSVSVQHPLLQLALISPLIWSLSREHQPGGDRTQGTRRSIKGVSFR
jgi:hypothetical protein